LKRRSRLQNRVQIRDPKSCMKMFIVTDILECQEG
jgi:hypothetical protein